MQKGTFVSLDLAEVEEKKSPLRTDIHKAALRQKTEFPIPTVGSVQELEGCLGYDVALTTGL